MLGIIHQRRCIYPPQHNGVAERKHVHLLEVARAIRFQGHTPLRLWGHGILDVAYVINRLICSSWREITLWSVFFNKKPSASHLRTLRCLCFAIALPKGDKFANRANKTIFMGYSSVTKGYILYDLEKHLFFANKDIIFRENVFPF